MASQQIKNLPEIIPKGAMKIPTGGFGDYAVTINSLANYTIKDFKINGVSIEQIVLSKVDKVIQEDSVATDVETLVADFNLLLSKLR